jgi:hypothetical protein
MNDALAPVEAVSGARGPLATLQALAEAVAAAMPPAPGNDTATTATASGLAASTLPAAPDAPAVAASTLAEPPAAALPEPTSTAQALHGRITLGQMAAEAQAAAQRAPAAEAAPAENARTALGSQPLADSSAAPRLADALAQPVLVTLLHSPALQPARPRDAAPARRVRPGEPDAAPPAEEAQVDDERAGDDGAEPDDSATPEALKLVALLQAEGPAEARSELARGRRVLVVLPQGGAGQGFAPARSWLVDTKRALAFRSRWWPGSAAATVGGGWAHWRVFRDGDPLLARGLGSRAGAGGHACKLLLGAAPQRLADAGAATLEVPERFRFAQALGGQWSLVVAAAPPGTAP